MSERCSFVMPRSLAARTSGLSNGMAVETTMASTPRTFSAFWPPSVIFAPIWRSFSMMPKSSRSEPDTS